jgi:hypothetical protein
MNAKQAAIKALVDEYFEGNYTAALLDIAREGDIAVAYLDREWITNWMDRDELTDDEWDEIRTELDSYDEWVSNTDDVNTDFIQTLLTERGFQADDETGVWRYVAA